MRVDPLVLTWEVRFPTEDARRAGQRLLAELQDPNYVWDHEMRTFPEGREQLVVHTHRLGDYFSGIEERGGPNPMEYQVVFHRQPTSGRFWKDLMVRTLSRLRVLGAEINRVASELPPAKPTGCDESGVSGNR